MSRFALTVVTLLVALACGADARAARGPDPETDRFLISAGTYLATFDTSAQFSPVNSVGTAIDVEEILGLDDRRTDVRIDGYWRFARRHRLDFGIFYDSRKGTRTISDQLIWNDVTYDAGVSIDSKFSTSYLKTAYRFAFVRDSRAEAGLSAGLATMRLGGELAGQGTVTTNGQTSAVGFVRESQSVIAPVPVIGLYASFVVVPGVFFRPSFEFFAFSSGGLEGSLVDSRATVDWFLSAHWGLGLGFSRTRLDFEDSEANPAVKAGNKVGGAVAYFTYGF